MNSHCTVLAAALLTMLSLELSGFTTVVIDAGHGGRDRGTMPGLPIAEKALALDLAQRIERLLRASGVHTVMTRRGDRYLSLPERVRIGNSQRDAVFVSVHFNASRNAAAAGIETFYSDPGSRRLAVSIQNNLMRACRTENRGVKRRGFYVLRHARAPAVLVECGFLTNRDEAGRCLDARYRQTLALQITRGILAARGGGRRPARALVVRNSAVDRAASGSASAVVSPRPATAEPRVVTRAGAADSRSVALAKPLDHYSQRELRRLFLEARRSGN